MNNSTARKKKIVNKSEKTLDKTLHGAITDTLDFTAATIQSNAESATDGCGGKKLINIERIEEVDENNKVMKDDKGNICYHPVDFCGMKITVADDTMLQLAQFSCFFCYK